MTASQTADRRRALRSWVKEIGWRHVLAIAAIVFALFPLVFVLSASLSQRGTLTGSSSLFSSFTIDSYIRLLTDPVNPYPRWFGNTILVAGVSALGTVILCATAAYAFSRIRFRGRRTGLVGLVLLQMFPQLLAYVAIFLLLIALGEVFPALGLNSHLALIMVYLGGALGVNTFLMYGFFNTIPKEIDEAATIDGAGHVRIFLMVLRLSMPILAVVGLLSFISAFDDFVIASVVLTRTEDLTLAVGLYGYVSGQFAKNWGVFAAGAVLAALPIVILFLYLQRHIVSGLAAGAVKG